MNALDKAQYKAKYQRLVFFIMPLLGMSVVFMGVQNKSPHEDYERGISAYAQRDYRHAVQDFRQDLVHNPDHSLGHYYLALALCRAGEGQAAKNEFKNASRTEMLSQHPDVAFAQRCALLENQPYCYQK